MWTPVNILSNPRVDSVKKVVLTAEGLRRRSQHIVLIFLSTCEFFRVSRIINIVYSFGKALNP